VPATVGFPVAVDLLTEFGDEFAGATGPHVVIVDFVGRERAVPDRRQSRGRSRNDSR